MTIVDMRDKPVAVPRFCSPDPGSNPVLNTSLSGPFGIYQLKKNEFLHLLTWSGRQRVDVDDSRNERGMPT